MTRCVFVPYSNQYPRLSPGFAMLLFGGLLSQSATEQSEAKWNPWSRGQVSDCRLGGSENHREESRNRVNSFPPVHLGGHSSHQSQWQLQWRVCVCHRVLTKWRVISGRRHNLQGFEGESRCGSQICLPSLTLGGEGGDSIAPVCRLQLELQESFSK